MLTLMKPKVKPRILGLILGRNVAGPESPSSDPPPHTPAGWGGGAFSRTTQHGRATGLFYTSHRGSSQCMHFSMNVRDHLLCTPFLQARSLFGPTEFNWREEKCWSAIKLTPFVIGTSSGFTENLLKRGLYSYAGSQELSGYR